MKLMVPTGAPYRGLVG